MNVQIDVMTTEKILGSLSAGDRAWFWFCPFTEEPSPILLLQPFATEGSMEKLLQQRRSLTILDGSEETMGIMSVGSDGRCRFVSQSCPDYVIDALSFWVHQNVKAAPSLAVLRNAIFTQSTEEGKIEKVFENAACWSEIPRIGVAGTAATAAAALNALQTNENAWFWMSSHGPGGAFLHIQPHSTDPDGTGFATEVGRLRLRSTSGRTTIRGVARLTDDGTLHLTTTNTPKGWNHIICRLLASNPKAFARLRTARIVRIKKDVIQRSAMLKPGEDLSLQMLSLKKLRRQEAMVFWFRPATSSQQGILLFDDSKTSLIQAAKAFDGAGKSFRGRVSLERKRFRFKMKNHDPDFIPALAAWVQKHSPLWTGLRKLRGASVCVGQEEYTNESAWNRRN